MAVSQLDRIIHRLQTGCVVEKSDVIYLLGLSDTKGIHQLFAAARKVRFENFSDIIFLYGFLYFSTYCRNNCMFCQYRQANTTLPRYRKTEKQILAAAVEMAEAGVHLIDLTMGDDPFLHSCGDLGPARLKNMIEIVQRETGLPIMLSPGILPDDTLAELADIGVTWYACYQETHNQNLYKTLRQGQDFGIRIEKKQFARKCGMLIEEGILTGVGESLEDLADSIFWMKENAVDQARVMTFVPQQDTPMADYTLQKSLQELKTIAVIRLMISDILIPASLDVNGLSGLKERLNAGANVVTSIVPPYKALAGVANSTLDIEEARRSLENILPVIKRCGLKAATREDYLHWVNARVGRKQSYQELQENLQCT